MAGIGLVPTMGNLHAGHLSLVKESLKDNQYTVVTIFVNPKQFGPNEDFDKYPRTLIEDKEKLESLIDSERIVLFAPEELEEVYPDGHATEIKVNAFTNILCDKFRPGHFHGVTTVLFQIFNLINPTVSYFGQKDYQQFKTIEKMVLDLSLRTQLKMIPIHRESDGLALSSRNQFLSENEREMAPFIYKTLCEVGEQWKGKGLSSVDGIIGKLSQDSNWQYLEILNSDNLDSITKDSTKVVVAGAYFMGDTRLIDNILVEKN